MITHTDWLTKRFDELRPRMRSVAFRMLGSWDEADDAVQEAWVRVARSGAHGVDNLSGWFTTIVARVSLNMLRSRQRRREVPLNDPLVIPDVRDQPEDEAILADSVSLALLIVLETLTPAERLAFVLHDMFDVPFDEIAEILDRSPDATRQIASRARRRVRTVEAPSTRDMARNREVVDAFFAAARFGDMNGLVAVLHPDVVLHAEFGKRSMDFRGVDAVLPQAKPVPGSELLPVLVDGDSGVVVVVHGNPFAILSFRITGRLIHEIKGIADPARVARLAAPVLDAAAT
jgi:RNA polymerase sigma-70 factor (ECF subfamily)